MRDLIHRSPRLLADALTGLAAAAAAVGAGELVAAYTGPTGAPVTAVGSAAIDLTPTPLKEYAVRSFGTEDKTVLLLGIYLTMAALAALAGLLAARRPVLGAGVMLAFGGLGAWAALSRSTATAVDALPSVVAALVGAGTLLVLARARLRTRAADGPPPPGPSRRTVLAATGATLLVGAGAGLGGRALADRRYDVSAARRAVRLPAPAVPAPPLPAGAGENLPGLSAFRTANQDFYRVDTALTLPRIDPRDWSLRVHGLVDRPLLLSFEDLLRRPLTELDYTLSCVSNEVGGPYVGTARWLGAPLADLLRQAGVRSGADQLVGRSKDGMTIGTPLDAVLDGRSALLAVAMNGEPLPVAHGFPCRSLVPGFYGYTSATKWLVDLEVTTFAAYDPYWVRRGWDRTGAVKTASRIEVPAPFARVPAGSVTVAGTAWATHRGIAAVELRVDGGPWQPARLAADAGPDLWRQWTYTWAGATPGTHHLEVRATDGTGAVQPEARTPPFPAGAAGWHSTVVTVLAN
ncbi:molybdopterin-binding oxidoreductase [Streptomyces tateyamensis]|uniref:Molybdopterin-binding oxidoreductase n=1 Tax=Streptomyces tateyamensis TaxID=565073 RepID=A0A2V4NZK4_9ACTN|nr:molybdopterin-dependent oxidoreductase [Streptomyces tateyamensis]PYC87673.1 molybdopterin-binding oxidoreductase [Streptomyces tateyamensis]